MMARERRFYTGLLATAIHELATDERRARVRSPRPPRAARRDEDSPPVTADSRLDAFALQRRRWEAGLAA